MALGLSSEAVDVRLEGSRLHRVHRGVYAVGQRHLRHEARWMAAVLACGAGAVLSHRSGGVHWGLVRSDHVPEVTAPTRLRTRRGIRPHQATLPPDERTIHEAIPVTTPNRTLFDLAAVLRERQLERAINEAEVRRLWDHTSLAALLDRYPRHRGNPIIRAALERRREGATVTRSELEELFVELLDAAGLPRPELNAVIEGFEVDAVWRDRRLIVELDGRGFHSTATAFERDRARDRALQAVGWRVVRLTYRQLRDAPEAVLADLHRLL
jgi:very-short-patch-repair endonuclease